MNFNGSAWNLASALSKDKDQSKVTDSKIRRKFRTSMVIQARGKAAFDDEFADPNDTCLMLVASSSIAQTSKIIKDAK